MDQKEKDIRRCYGNFLFESTIPQVLDHSYIESSFSASTRHLHNGIWKTSSNWQYHQHGSTKVSSLHQDIWRIVVCFFFSQTNLDFKFNLNVDRIIFVTIYLTFYLAIFCVFWSSSSTSKLFSWEPIKFCWGSMLFFVTFYSHKMLFFYIP